jgi:hypothetical protein
VFIASLGVGESRDCLDYLVHPAWIRLSIYALQRSAALSRDDTELQHHIAQLIESVKDDRIQTNQLFQYVWTLMCVRRGLMRVLRVVQGEGARQLVVEEIHTGRLRIVARPPGLDAEVEGLAVQALARILSDVKPWDRRRPNM